MTKLRDDGYLETDDPVVAACFLGKTVFSERKEQCFELEEVSKAQPYGHFIKPVIAYPILIPARTVAEVYDSGDTFTHAVLGSIGMYEHPTMTLDDWLRTHTEATE